MSASLWEAFLKQLGAHNVDLDDIADCTPETLQSLLKDLGFNALQSAKLQTEWTRRKQQQREGASSSAGQRYASSSSNGSLRPARTPVTEGSGEFVEVANHALDFFATAMAAHGQTASILGVECVTNPSRERACRDFRGKMCDPTAPAMLKGRIVPIDLVDRTIANGAVPHPTVDRALPCGLVFHGEADDSGPASMLIGPDAVPAKLVLFDVALGNAKILSEDDAAALSVYPADEIQQSLRQEGYDSIQVQHAHAYRPDAFAVFDGRVAFAKYIVTFSCSSSPARGASPSGGHSRQAAVNRSSSAVLDHSGSVAPFPHGSDASATQTCSMHPGKPFEFWCVDEKKLVCSHCMFLGGYQHKRCVLIDEGADEEKDWVRTWVEKAEVFSSDVGKVMASFDAAMDSVDTGCDRALDELALRVQRLKDQLDEAHERAQDRVRAAAKSQTVSLQRALSEVVALQASVDDVSRAARRAVVSGSSVDILTLRETASRQWPPVEVPDYQCQRVREQDGELIAQALSGALATEDAEGAVELPVVIDVNQLSATVDQEHGRIRPTAASTPAADNDDPVARVL